VNLLDENILVSQRELLMAWRIRVRHVGHDIGSSGVLDEAIAPLLCRLTLPTLFTRDQGFYRRSLCHRRYCIVVLTVGERQVAAMIRRLLRHPEFDTRAKRMGAVARVSPGGIHLWRWRSDLEETVGWRR
jgi:hypothetical protein